VKLFAESVDSYVITVTWGDVAFAIPADPGERTTPADWNAQVRGALVVAVESVGNKWKAVRE